MFRGSRAVAVDCVSAGEPLRIGFERLIVACGGLENTALLRRSNLPRGTGAGAGRHLQDHAACEVLVALPTPFRRFHLGAEGGVEIPELSGYFGGLGVQALMLPVELQHGQMDSLIATQGQPIPALFWRASALDRLARLYLQLEIPPEWGMELRCRGEATFIHAMPYLANLPRMDAAVLQVLRRIADRGLEIVRVQPYYRHSFGGHHYGGTTAMSRTPAAIVDPDQRLIGTDNVYVSGASVLPRCGPSGPTLSIVALGLRLGARLSTD
jgi:choline dehydrogenase-like flavoprotein